MNLPDVVITGDMSEEEKRSLVHRAILMELEAVAATPGWELLMNGLEVKVERLTQDLLSTNAELSARDEDRKRGEIAAYRDVLATVTKAEARAKLLDHQAATIKEQERERTAADPLAGLGSFPAGAQF